MTENTGPSMETGRFELDDWTFVRFEPANDREPHECLIVATKGDERHTRTVPLYHPNLFGLDVEDAAAVNDAVEALITELGIDP